MYHVCTKMSVSNVLIFHSYQIIIKSNIEFVVAQPNRITKAKLYNISSSMNTYKAVSAPEGMQVIANSKFAKLFAVLYFVKHNNPK